MRSSLTRGGHFTVASILVLFGALVCASASMAVENDTELTLQPSSAPAPNGAASGADELAKQTLNPVADLISVPLQYNIDFNVGPSETQRQILNIQPVIPITLNEDWNLITRTILPIIDIGSIAPGVDSNCGLGDTTQSFFLSPKKPTHGWIWGAGPVFYWPTGTNGLSGRKWGAGPTAVALRQENGWTYGMLANHIWSFAGSDSTEDVNATLVQPFLSYTFKTHTSISLNTETTYDWNAGQATVPVNLLVSQILKIGKFPISLQFGPRYYLDGPEGNPDWGLRFTFTFLFPK